MDATHAFAAPPAEELADWSGVPTERRGMSWQTEDSDGSVVITLRLPADEAMSVIASVEAATEHVKGVPGVWPVMVRSPRWSTRPRVPDRRLEVRFPAGNLVERLTVGAPFVAPAPTNPGWISSAWTGERLELDRIHLIIGNLEDRACTCGSSAA